MFSVPSIKGKEIITTPIITIMVPKNLADFSSSAVMPNFKNKSSTPNEFHNYQN